MTVMKQAVNLLKIMRYYNMKNKSRDGEEYFILLGPYSELEAMDFNYKKLIMILLGLCLRIMQKGF